MTQLSEKQRLIVLLEIVRVKQDDNGEANSVSANNRQKWDLGRFWQTLSYFEVFPVISCLQRLLTGQDKHEAIANTMQTDGILVIGATSGLGQLIVARLQQQHYRVRALVKNDVKAKAIFSEGVELFVADLTIPESLTSSLMTDIAAIIYCTDLVQPDSPSIADNPEASQYTRMTNLLKIAKPSLNAGEKRLFDFSKPSSNLREVWGAVDDVVMGGVSQSGIRLVGDRAIFSGNVSTANNGGFASIRTRNLTPPIDLSAYQGIALRVKGDGDRYKFIIRAEGKWDGIGYSYSFDTVKDSWITVKIPFSELIPVFRAKTVPDAGTFNHSQVYSMQLMLSKFEYDGRLNPHFSPGFFQLEIESISAYGNRQATPQLIYLSSASQKNNLLIQTSEEQVNHHSDNIRDLRLKTESLIRENDLNYTIIRLSNLSETPVKKVSDFDQVDNLTYESNLERIAELCVGALRLPEVSNKDFEVEALDAIAGENG